MLTIQYLQHSEIEHLDSEDRINKLLEYARQGTIILLEGRLRKNEETDLIARTMESIDNKFKGIEIATISPESDAQVDLLRRIRAKLTNVLLGDRQGMTIIGPATIVKEIKQDPNKIQVLLNDSRRRR